jgi:predicted Zn-dependent protease
MGVFFGRMQSGNRVYESAAPAYLRTHPMPAERIGDIQTRLRDLRVKQRADSIDFHLVRARLRVLQDPSIQGAADALLHFENQLQTRSAPLEAAAHYGVAVAALRLDRPQLALEAAQAARRLVDQPNAMLDKAVSETRYTAARTPQERAAALQLARDASVRFPLSRMTALHYTDLLQREARHDDAVAFLREQLALPRSDTAYFALLAKSYAALDRKTLHHQAVAEAYALQGAAAAAVEQLQLARKAADADFYVLSEVDARLRQLSQQVREDRDEALRQGQRPPEEEPRPRR